MPDLNIFDLLSTINAYQKHCGRISCEAIQNEKELISIPWLEDIKFVLEILSDNAFSQVNVWTIKDGQAVNDFGCNFHAATNTIKLVEYAFFLGDIADVYILLRKIFESLLQHLFFHVIREKTQAASLELNDENVNQLFDTYLFNDAYATDKSKMDYWATGTPLDEKKRKSRRKTITIQKYINFLKKENSRLSECMNKFLPEVTERLLRKMDDFTHGNKMVYYNQVLGNHKIHKMIERDSTVLVTILMVYVTIIKASLLSSSDYVDALEAGIAPKESSQYWIAPIFNDFFDKYAETNYPGLKEFLNSNNSANMKIFE
ncbi:MAG: hypothetical protein K9K78_05340 [Spirochaetales bacterium]|nr:hypothetical protein [Spirochaetales bacterium]